MSPINDVKRRPNRSLSSAADGKRYDATYFADELHRDHWFRNNAAKRRRRWNEVLRMLEPGRDDRVLEIGSAAGAHTLRLAPLVRDVIGIDRAIEGAALAKRNATRQGVANAAFAVCDAASLAFAGGIFSKVAAIDFVEHVDDDILARVFSEVHRVLTATGRLAIYTPCATHYVERLKSRNLILKQIAGHVAVRPPEAYARLLAQAGFDVSEQWFLPSDYPAFGLIDRIMMHVPGVRRLFRFRICIVAMKTPS